MLLLPLFGPLDQLSDVAGKTQCAQGTAGQRRKMTPQDPTAGPEQAVLPTYDVTIRKEWIDRNDHMNNSFYLLASQGGCLGALRVWRGDYVEGERGPFGNFVTQALVTYIREVRFGIRLSIRCRLVGCDE